MNTPNHLPPVWEVNKCVRIPAGDVFLLGDLQIPEESTGLVIFAYGSGRARNNPRVRHTALVLRNHGIATLLCELLTEAEEIEDESTGNFRNDAGLLAQRLIEVTRWTLAQPETRDLQLAYFGACAGGAAAVIAATAMKDKVRAVVCRGGRMDLATRWLTRLKCPTLLIVGGEDALGIEMNRDAFSQLRCEKQLQEVPGASHLFGEPGKLMEMAELTAQWLVEHLRHDVRRE